MIAVPRPSSTLNANFWRLWGGIVLGDLADGTFRIALPLLATRATTSPLLVAGVAFMLYLPWLLFGLFAGVLADRFNRKWLVVRANGLRVGVLLVLVSTLLVAGPQLGVLYFAAFFLGLAETIADTASTTLLPSIVARDELERANARLMGAQTVVSSFAGPIIGGALVTVGVALAIGASGSLYALALFGIITLTGTFQAAHTRQSSVWHDSMEGLRYLARHRLFRALVVMVSIMNLVWSAWASVLVLYVVAPGPVGLNALGYGAIFAAMGVGGILGTVLVEPVRLRWGRRWAIGADIIGTFLMGATPFLTTNPWAIGGAALIGGMGSTMWSVTVVALRQRLVPDQMLGRVSGAMRLAGMGAIALGSLTAGIVAETIGVRAVFAVTALLTALLVIPFNRFMTPRALEGEAT